MQLHALLHSMSKLHGRHDRRKFDSSLRGSWLSGTVLGTNTWDDRSSPLINQKPSIRCIVSSKHVMEALSDVAMARRQCPERL